MVGTCTFASLTGSVRAVTIGRRDPGYDFLLRRALIPPLANTRRARGRIEQSGAFAGVRNRWNIRSRSRSTA